MHGNADGAPSTGSGVGDEVESGGVKGLEAEADHESAGDGDGSAESGAAFDERAEAEGDEKELKAAIGSDGGDGLLHDFELAGLDGDVVEKDSGDDNPDDFEEAVGGSHRAKLVRASCEGMWKTKMEQRRAVVAPAMAQRWARTLKPASKPRRTTTGRAATRVESHQWWRGS